MGDGTGQDLQRQWLEPDEVRTLGSRANSSQLPVNASQALIVVMHSNPGRIMKEIINPFARQLGQTTATQLRLSKEFVEMRELLVSDIREANIQ